MSELTKQQQKDKARKAYEAINVPARKAYDAIEESAHRAYVAKLVKINRQPDEVAEIITFKGREYKLIGGEK